MVQFADRVKVGNTTAASAGSATTLTLGSAETGYQAVPSSLDGETIRYVIEEGNTWEIGTGTYTHSGTTLTRSVASSSNSNNAIAVTTNSKVFITPVVDDLQLVQVYSSTSDLPSASDNHGRITHVHGEGAMYFAHGGNWIKLANASDAYTLPTASSSALGGIKIGTGLSIDGSGVVTASGSGGSATVNYSPAFVGARWKFPSTVTQSISGTTVINQFTSRDYDTTSNNDFTGTNNRLTIPSGVSRVIARASIETSDVAGQVSLKIIKNGGDVESTNQEVQSDGGDYAATTTPVISVSQNDYFEVAVFTGDAGSAVEDSKFTWFEIQVIEGSILNSVPQTVQPYDANLKSFTDTFTLPTSDGSANQVLKTDGSGAISFADQSGGIALTDLSVTQNAASGSGALAYNNSSGVFSYTPPASTSSSGGTLDPIKETETAVSASTQSAFNVTHAVGNIAVYLNGSRLSDADWNSNSGGTTVTLTAAAVQNDIVTVVEYGAPFAAPYSSAIYTVGSSSEINANRDVLTADYTNGKEAVYVNGVKLLGGGTDYSTNTAGDTITFTSALSTNDKVELVEHGALADAASAFTELTDTPSSLGTAGQLVQVNSAGNALEFADASSGGVTTGKAIAMSIVFGG